MTPRRLPICLLPFVLAAGVTACTRAGASGGSADTSTPPPLPRAEALELRRVWSGPAPNFYPSTASPDGRLITEIDWTTGDLAVIDLESGKLRRVTNKGPWSQSGEYAEYSVFSPDGKRIAYSWFSREAHGYQARTIGLDGSDMRIVFERKPDVAYVEVRDWSRDATSILVTLFRTDRTTQIGTVSVENGAYRALKTNDWRSPSVSAFSPNGRYVAYDLARSTGQSEHDILVLAVDGSRERKVVGGTGDNRLLGWLPDGRGILYHRRTSDSRGLMALSVEDGQAVGRSQLVRPDVLQMLPLGFSRDAYFYGVEVERPQIHVVSVDLATGHVVTEPAPLPGDSVEGHGHDAAWSPDGQTVAYLIDAPAGATMVIRSITGELRRQIPVALTQARKTRWMPDGSAVLVYGTDVEGRVGIHRVQLRSGELTPVSVGSPSGETEGMAFWSLSPDGRTIYHRRPKAEGQQHLPFFPGEKPTEGTHVIVARDVASGKSRELLQAPQGRIMSVAPDGRWLAFTAHDLLLKETRILLVPTAGGAPREIYRQRGGNTLGNRGGIEWAPDGRSVLFFFAPDAGPGGIWQVPVDGGAPRLLLDDRQLTPLVQGERTLPKDFRLSRDGRRLAYETGRSRGEFWMLSGFATAMRQ